MARRATARRPAPARDATPAPERGPAPPRERDSVATRDHHPARRTRADAPAPVTSRVEIPRDVNDAEIDVGSRAVKLTNLQKVFWPQDGITKGDLLRYYATMAPVLLPHIRDRAMVMKRYPNGADGAFFFMKRAPSPRPDWIELCRIHHPSEKVIDFPVIQDLASLLWVVNLGCIDLNQWYARCDDVDRPDYVHFDLDPGEKASFDQVRETALVVRDTLEGLDMPSHAKTTGSRGIHVYVPIVRGPTQQQVWSFAKTVAVELAAHHPKLMTSVYAKARRPTDRVHVDYNQNAWGRTLASVYVEVFRAVPVLTQLFVIYFGLAGMGIRLNPLPAAIIGFGINGGAYLTEVFRAGIEAIHQGQLEGAFSIGMTRPMAMWYIILPQAVRVVLPPIGNFGIGLLKDTSIASAVAAPELMFRARSLVEATFLSTQIYLMVALLYLAMSLPLSRVVRHLEAAMGRGHQA